VAKSVDEKLIRDNFGEKMWHHCRSAFPTLLESEGLLSKVMLEHFAPSRSLIDILLKDTNNEDSFKSYIFSFIDVEKEDKPIATKTPEQLLDEAGYILYPECETEEEIQRFKRFYAGGEQLCTFRGGRLNSCRIWFAVKKNASELRREEFKQPQRQDEYGTSVISIQFTRGSQSTVSIKNRYNHTVNHPDATFNNDLDRIVPGLEGAFCRTYGIELVGNGKQKFDILNFVMANDGKFYKTNVEIGGVNYCENNIVIDQAGNARQYDPSTTILMGSYLVDLKGKRITDLSEAEDKSFAKTFGELKEIRVEKMNSEGDRRITFININNEESYVEVNKSNEITAYENDHVTEMGEKCLMENANALTRFSAHNLESMGNSCLYTANSLTQFSAPNLVRMGNSCLYTANSLTQFSAPNLVRMGDACLSNANSLTQFIAPNLERMGNWCLQHVNSLTEFSAPNLVSMGDACLRNVNSITGFNAPKLKSMGNSCLYTANSLSEFSAPNLVSMGNWCLYEANSLSEFSAPNLESMGNSCLWSANSLSEFSALNLESMGDACLQHVNLLTGFNAPNLVRMCAACLYNANSLSEFTVPKLESLGYSCLYNANSLTEFSAPNLESMGDSCLERTNSLTEFSAPNLESMGYGCLYEADALTKFNAPKLEGIVADMIRSTVEENIQNSENKK